MEVIHMSELKPTPDPEAQQQAQRQRLAELIGRLLARYWLRHRQNSSEAEPERPRHPRDAHSNTD